MERVSAIAPGGTLSQSCPRMSNVHVTEALTGYVDLIFYAAYAM